VDGLVDSDDIHRSSRHTFGSRRDVDSSDTCRRRKRSPARRLHQAGATRRVCPATAQKKSNAHPASTADPRSIHSFSTRAPIGRANLRR
jgi:hypothetical protein